MKIITVTLSPALDVTYRLSSELCGELNRAREFTVTPGGKGINVSKAVHRATESDGGSNKAELYTLITIGGRVGDALSGMMEDENSFGNVTSVKTEAQTRVNVSAISESGCSTEINGKSSVTPDELQKIEELILSLTESGDVVALCGSSPKGVEPGFTAEICRKIREKGGICVVDCDGEALYLAVNSDCPPSIIKPNAGELSELCERLKVDVSPESVAKFTGGKTAVLATYGGGGASFTQGENTVFAAAHPIDGDKIQRIKGAGDTLLGTFLYLRFFGKREVKDALEMAAKAASDHVSGK